MLKEAPSRRVYGPSQGQTLHRALVGVSRGTGGSTCKYQARSTLSENASLAPQNMSCASCVSAAQPC
eukprot:2939322-Alexandrium_andersonii.AAC.1